MIEIKDLSFSYHGKPLFQDLSLRLEDNPLTAVLGLNGEGKTTLLKMMLGLLKADKGNILIDGKEIQDMKEKERSRILSYVPQEMDDSLDMSASDFICMGAMNRQNILRGPDENDRNKADLILKDLGVLDLETRSLSAMSTGQKRMIYLARSIFQDSSYMIMDEPAASLDLLRQHRFLKLLKNYAVRENKQVIMSIHDPQLAYAYADVFLFFKDHKIIDLLSKEEEDFRERFQEDIRILYDNEVDVVYREGRVSIDPLG